MALRNIIWNFYDVNLQRIALTDEDEFGAGPVPPLRPGITIEEYLTEPINLIPNAEGQVILVFVNTELLKSVNTNSRTGRVTRITTPLEVVYEQDQLPDGLHVLGALAELAATEVPYDILKAWANAHREQKGTTYEELASIAHSRGAEIVKYSDILSGSNFIGLKDNRMGQRLPVGTYAVLLN